MKTLKMMLEESGSMMKFDCMLNEAFSSNIMAELHKNNPETMNQFFRSLAKFRYSVQGLKDEFISKISVSDALAKNKSDKILKIWMKGPKVAFFSVANTVIDTEFNWNGKTSREKRDNSKVFGDPELVQRIMDGEKWSNIGLTDVYQIAISSMKALGEKKEPTEVPTKDDTVIKVTYTPNYTEVPKAMKKKPSGINKKNNTSKKRKVHFKASDIYDLHDEGYDQDVTYYSDECDGFIFDKQGIKHGVIGGSWTSDTGRIAGGTINYRITILKANGKDDAHFSGYQAVFSSPSSKTCATIVDDIDAGMYMEDYIAKHWADLAYNECDKFKEQFDAGDPTARTFVGIKKDAAQIKVENFWARYLLFSNAIRFEITQDGIKLSKNILNDDKELGKYRQVMYDKVYSDEVREKNREMHNQIIEKKFEVLVNGILVPIITRELKKFFKTGTISNYAGIEGYIGFVGTKIGTAAAFDSVDQKFVLVDPIDSKLVDGNPRFIFDGQLTFYKNKASAASAKLFKAASDAFIKANKKKQTEYVNANWEKIYNASFTYWKYSKTKGQARAEAKQKFINMLNKNTYENSNYLTFAWEMLKDFIEQDASYVDSDVQATSDKPAAAPVTVEKFDVDTIMNSVSAKVLEEQTAKMLDWDRGARKQNVKAMGDDKLKLNYAICIKWHLDNCKQILRQEAMSRNIVLD